MYQKVEGAWAQVRKSVGHMFCVCFASWFWRNSAPYRWLYLFLHSQQLKSLESQFRFVCPHFGSINSNCAPRYCLVGSIFRLILSEPDERRVPCTNSGDKRLLTRETYWFAQLCTLQPHDLKNKKNFYYTKFLVCKFIYILTVFTLSYSLRTNSYNSRDVYLGSIAKYFVISFFTLKKPEWYPWLTYEKASQWNIWVMEI